MVRERPGVQVADLLDPAAKTASRGTLGESQCWCRHGLSRWGRRIRRTVSGEIDATTPSATSCRASSGLSHTDRLRPASRVFDRPAGSDERPRPDRKKGLRPRPGLSYSPAIPSAMNRLIHFSTNRRRMPTVRPISLSVAPSLTFQDNSGPFNQSDRQGSRTLPGLKVLAFFRRQIHKKFCMTTHGISP